MSTPIPLGLPNPPYLYAAVNADHEEVGIKEIYRLMVLHEQPTAEKMKDMEESIEEDKSIVDPYVIIEGPESMFEQFQQETYYMYAKMLH